MLQRMTNTFLEPARLPLVAASVLGADFAHLAADCATVLPPVATGAGAADALHLDVMDGHFVPNLTMGPDLARGLRGAFPDVTLDAHLMVQQPDLFVDAFADAGVDHFTFHIEPAIGIYRSKGEPEGPPLYDAVALAQRVRDAGMSVGVAINPLTPVDALLPVLDIVDLVLVMSVHPGFAGQRFIQAALATTRALRTQLRDNQRVQMDGGVGPANAQDVRDAGCDVLVAASAIFKHEPEARPGAVSALRVGANPSVVTSKQEPDAVQNPSP